MSLSKTLRPGADLLSSVRESKNPVIVLSRTDKIGDVVLTLPMAGLIKEALPESRVLFLGQAYTRAIIEASRYVDRFLDWGEISKNAPGEQIRILQSLGADAFIHVFPNRTIATVAKQAKIPIRIGTNRRVFHWWSCSHRVNLTRRHSGLHESQLNTQLLTPLLGAQRHTLSQLGALTGLRARTHLPPKVEEMLHGKGFRLVLHPKSRGSAREWPLGHYRRLLEGLSNHDLQIFVTGTGAEAEDVEVLLKDLPADLEPRVHNLVGKMNLQELMSFLSRADGFVGASTGPLHLAGALGVRTLGLYPPIQPMNWERWGPLGPKSKAISSRDSGACSACRKTEHCPCMTSLTPERVLDEVSSWIRADGMNLS